MIEVQQVSTPHGQLTMLPAALRSPTLSFGAGVGATLGAMTATDGTFRRTTANWRQNTCSQMHLRAAVGGPSRTAFERPPHSSPSAPESVEMADFEFTFRTTVLWVALVEKNQF